MSSIDIETETSRYLGLLDSRHRALWDAEAAKLDSADQWDPYRVFVGQLDPRSARGIYFDSRGQIEHEFGRASLNENRRQSVYLEQLRRLRLLTQLEAAHTKALAAMGAN
jgi:hypothetical protein